jgi:protein ImuA
LQFDFSFDFMNGVKNLYLQGLQKDILSLEGYKSLYTDNSCSIGFKPIENAFPTKCFPIGSMHEFLSTSFEDAASTNGFISGLLSKLMHLGGVCIWISASRTVFPSALKGFGIEPDQVIFVDLKKERDVFYAMDEALKCEKLISVVGEIKEISFKESRRLQLAVEQSRVTGFILRNQPRVLNTIACVSRWRIKSLSSELSDGIPGVGFPRWNVELLKVRNGKPGNWKIEWSSNRFNEITENIISIPQIQIRNVG